MANTPKNIAKALIIISVHLDAFWHDPKAYLTAVKWRILGKKLRARAQFAPLLSHSPKAYTLWQLRMAKNKQSYSPQGQMPPLIALVTANGAQPALDETLASLAAEGVEAWTVDADTAGGLRSAAASIDWGASPWLLPLAAGDRLAPGAAAAYRAAIAQTTALVIYADDDLIKHADTYFSPHFKPDWNGELFEHFDYLTGACIMQAGPDDLAAAADNHDWAAALVAKAVQKDGAVHIREILHHRAARIAPPTTLTPIVVSADCPPISVIVPTRNRADLLQTCLTGLMATHYPNIEIIVVDNDSDDPETLAYLATIASQGVRVLRHQGPFNYSAINNRAVAQASGHLLCLLNNDIEVMSPDWLGIMATQAVRPDVGAVGAQLLYPGGRIQHAGVVAGVGNAAGHAHRFLFPHDEGYFRRHTLPQFTSAVTAACLVVERDRFLAVGGLDESNFAVAFNDVDLCLKLNRRGWQSLYEARAILIHHESVTRGLDHDPVGAARFAGELAALKRIWKTDEIIDPYHHPYLSRASEQFAVALL